MRLSITGSILVLAGVILWLFGPGIDQHILNALRLSSGDRLVGLAAGLSSIGGLACLGPLALAFVVWLIWRKRHIEALWLLITLTSGRLVAEALKLVFETPRPPLTDRLALVTSYSFPSSHSAGSMLTALALATLFSAGGRSPLVPAVLFAAAVGWSRMALGVHWPSDVLAGWGFGMLWVCAARRWLPRQTSQF